MMVVMENVVIATENAAVAATAMVAILIANASLQSQHSPPQSRGQFCIKKDVLGRDVRLNERHEYYYLEAKCCITPPMR